MKQSENIILTAYICSVVVLIVVALFLSSLLLYHDLNEISLISLLTTLTVSVLVLLLSYYFGKKIYMKGRVDFYTVSISLFLSITIPLLIIEFIASRSVPPWPAIALHGVDPEIGKTQWGRVQSLYSEATNNNSWGQRDRERSIEPPDDKTRIAFIGDSFLEESSIKPVSLLVEELLPPSYEVINLGVSATDPVHYYWALKNVALELGVKHVFVFMFIGNDLLDDKPADDRGIIASSLLAPPPQSSLLGTLMPATNYHLTKKYKKSTTAWMARDLHHYEQSQLELFRKVGMKKLPLLLARYNSPAGEKACYDKLLAHNLFDFYKMLINPDMGLFRTYIIGKAVTNFCQPIEHVEDSLGKSAGSYSIQMVNLMKDVARKNDVGISFVIVPQGFDVDDRFWEQWKVLADFREIYNHSLKASYFKRVLLNNNSHVVDLYPSFESKTGTYLNVDGHWSKLGNELAAKELVQEIKSMDIK